MTHHRRFDVIAFDADDTLWHELGKYYDARDQFVKMLSRYHSAEWIEERLDETDIRNLKIFGYGVKGFVLSMIETAIELTEGRVTGAEIQTIIDFGRNILSSPIDILPYVRETIEQLRQTHTLMIITKGDLFDQETKIARSGMADCFEYIEIVSNKTPDSYDKLLRQYSIVPERFLMVGNSLKSDILPIVELGGHAVHIPYHITWEHENAPDADQNGFARLDDMSQLITYIRQIEGN